MSQCASLWGHFKPNTTIQMLIVNDHAYPSPEQALSHCNIPGEAVGRVGIVLMRASAYALW